MSTAGNHLKRTTSTPSSYDEEIPVNGWFFPCRLCRAWTAHCTEYTVMSASVGMPRAAARNRGAEVPCCRRCELGLMQQLKERRARAQDGGLLFISPYLATPAAPSVLPAGADEQLFNKPSDQKACSRSSCSSQQESAYYAKLSSSSCPAQGQQLPAHSAKLSISNSPEQQRTASSQEHGSQEMLELTRKPSTCGSSFCPSHSCASSFCPGAEISGVTSAGSGGAHLTSPGSVSLEQGVVSHQQATRRVKQRLF
ncbi:hypothetical protein DUNSADRAFT_9107 [Dunaliella salina]|uniref:Uncharacterized protein n=1 Tax=Dunaliella salina TaxID=3046 RepID=A0ABQ7H5M4_DUNSA|nr:hypothetical protein DUNSADRAFT_9107 [Dunaliella salina]|eukprot:KAF5842148.1 hypothetical protein DUNSADRAFT_9107 [Dunaliella salina]